MEKRLDGMHVAMLVSDDFEQVEMTEPRKALEAAGAQVELVSDREGHVQGMRHDEKADRFPVDRSLEEADPAGFDALVLPGGALNADELRMNPKAREFVRHMDGQGKPMAVICHAPWLLVSSRVLSGRRLTSWPTIQDDIRNAGGEWVDQEVVLEGNLLTSRGPKDLPAFNRAMVDLFGEHRQGKTGRRAA
jgi:protease I